MNIRHKTHKKPNYFDFRTQKKLASLTTKISIRHLYGFRQINVIITGRNILLLNHLVLLQKFNF